MEKAYSVRQLNSYLDSLISTDPFLKDILVEGEVSNLKYHDSGHVYFTLKDGDGKAALRCVMFRSDRAGGLTFPMKNGDQVTCRGRIGIYSAQGSYQLYCKRIRSVGAGDLYLRFEELKKELAESGMFDASYKKPIPKFPKKVGIVTAPTGAAVRDILSIAGGRDPYVQLILFPARVQGEGAASSIARGIRALDAYGVDTIIVGRGGGSIEDLWAFNEKETADAIFASTTPVISGVGHETDTTIADFVADVRAETPSAAAMIAVPEIAGIDEELMDLRAAFLQGMEKAMSRAGDRASSLVSRFRLLSPERKLDEKKLSSDALRDRLRQGMEQKLREAKGRRDQIPARLTFALSGALLKERGRVRVLAARLDGLSPAKKLALGYAWPVDGEGRHKGAAKDYSPRDPLLLYMKDGELRCTVDEVKING